MLLPILLVLLMMTLGATWLAFPYRTLSTAKWIGVLFAALGFVNPGSAQTPPPARESFVEGRARVEVVPWLAPPDSVAVVLIEAQTDLNQVRWVRDADRVLVWIPEVTAMMTRSVRPPSGEVVELRSESEGQGGAILSLTRRVSNTGSAYVLQVADGLLINSVRMNFTEASARRFVSSLLGAALQAVALRSSPPAPPPGSSPRPGGMEFSREVE